LHGKRKFVQMLQQDSWRTWPSGSSSSNLKQNAKILNGNFTVSEVKKCVNVKIKDESLAVLLSCYEGNYPLWNCFFIIIIFQHPVAVIS
jgi:hypothetical protein